MLDNLLATLLREKDEASKRYFGRLLAKSGDGGAAVAAAAATAPSIAGGGGGGGVVAGVGGGGKFSPVEALFQKHMRKSLADFSAYNTALSEKKEMALHRLRDVYIERMGKAKNEVEAKYPRGQAPRAALDAALQPLEAQMNSEVERVKESFDKSVALLLEAFDRHLAVAAPSISQLPVTVTVVVEASNTTVGTLAVQATDTIREVRTAVMGMLERAGNPVMAHTERCLFFLQRSYEVGAAAKREMLNEAAPLGTLKIEPGSLLLWSGDVKLKRDMPSMCFVLTFDKEHKEPMDYFSCKNCGINWVCPACVRSCHAGHQIVPHLKNHTPTWACCYCSKKGLCKIDKKS